MDGSLVDAGWSTTRSVEWDELSKQPRFQTVSKSCGKLSSFVFKVQRMKENVKSGNYYAYMPAFVI